jgi:chromosomal replication initiator protein
MDIFNLWKEISFKLSSVINSAAYTIWIQTLQPLCVKDNVLVLLTESNSNRQIIKKGYLKEIKKALISLETPITDVEIIIEEEKHHFKDEIERVENKKREEEEPVSNGNSVNPNSKYTFDTFVVGESNKLAYNAALAVAKSPGAAGGFFSFNPLYIYGGVGLGKTHLIQAVWNYLKENNPKLKILYVPAERMTNDFVEALQNSNLQSKDAFNMVAFRNKYRNVDVLMIEDIQFLQNKAGSQDMFFHIFNELYQQNKQIILSSDRPPKEIGTLEDRLVSRFEGGILVDVSKPDIETRIAIVRKKLLLENIIVPDDVIYYVAERFDSNVRELEGALSRILLYAQLCNLHAPTLESAKDALQSSNQPGRTLDANDIITAVCSYLKVSKSDIISKKKTKEVAQARHIAVYLIYNLLSMPLSNIGQIFGGRDHTTIMNSRDQITARLPNDRALEMQIKDIKGILNIK